jgi:hypothetical protein
MRKSAWLSLLAALWTMSLFGCDDDRGEGAVFHPPSNRDEKAAAVVFDAFARALARNDPAAACSYATGKAYAAYRCDAAPRLPAKLTGRRKMGPIMVRDPSAYDADLHLSARLINDPQANLVLFFKHRDDEWRVNDALMGAYG